MTFLTRFFPANSITKCLTLISYSLLSIFILINCSKSSKEKSAIDVAKFNIDSLDATPAFLRAIEAAKEQKANKIIVPTGIYEFFPAKAFEKYCAITNNDNGSKRIAFPLIGFDNLEIDGQGSTFIFHGQMVPFVIENSSNISLKNFNIDYKRPHHSEGTVVSVNEGNHTFDLQMDSAFTYEIRGNQLIYIGENGYEQSLQENVFFDPIKGGIAYDDTKYTMDPWMKRLDYEYSAKDIGNRTVRILDTVAEALPKVGWIFATKGYKMPNRVSPGIHLIKSANISLTGINIYHAGAMGIVGEKCENILLNKVNIKLPPNCKRMMSVAADATHFSGCKGEISIVNCTFENMHDDGTNIHSAYAIVNTLANDHTLLVKLKHHQQFGFEFAASGDSVSFVEKQTLLPYYKTIVKSVKRINEEYSEIAFKESIKEILKPNSAIDNITWYPSHVVLKGCTIRNNRARGFLISSRGKIEIENNYFSNEMAGIHISGDANYWCESGAVNDVVIKHNIFENCATSRQNQPLIYIDPVILDLNKSGYYHSNISILENEFNTFDRSILRAKSVDGLIFSSNKIVQTKTFQPFYPENPTIDITKCNHVEVNNNIYEGEKPATILSDSLSKIKIKAINNQGFTP